MSDLTYAELKAQLEARQELARANGCELLTHLHASELRYGDTVLLSFSRVKVRRTERGLGEEVIVIEQGTGTRHVLRDGWGSYEGVSNDVWRPLP